MDDLSDWRYEGIIFRKNQDSKNKLGLRLLFAPDVCQGPDGRYYLYYAFDFMGVMGVAVCDTPAGQYEFLGHVHYPDGTVWGRRKGDQFPFDPGVLADDDGRVWLYSGFYTPMPAIVTGFQKLKNDGGTVVELERDMVTIKGEPKVIFPKAGPGSFPNHEFFEASSIRKDGDKYIFVYSSRHNHELCYAVSDRPDGGFVFGGTLVSQGDLFLDGNEDEAKALNYLGNTHGGLLNIREQWYIFYHRQTNRHSYSRQACAEKLERTPDGGFRQAEVTSCGLNGGPLAGEGYYPSCIACHLFTDRPVIYVGDSDKPEYVNGSFPKIVKEGWDGDQNEGYITNMYDQCTAGFRYFDLSHVSEITLTIRGYAYGSMEIRTSFEGSAVKTIPLHYSNIWRDIKTEIKLPEGADSLYFTYRGPGSASFKGFTLK